VPTTSGRIRGRQGAHSGAPGPAGDHLQKIMVTVVTATVIIVFVLVMTKAGRDIDAATQHFMLFYAGVFALIGLTGAVMIGLLATDRIVMTPGHRVMAQAVHRAVSFGALAFLVIHIVTEILAQRVHVIDAFIPFLSPFRTFYIGLGTIASDLILFIVITSIFRKRFTSHGKAWRWRAIHYSSYLAFVFGVLHGLLGGRAAKPYVDWSYGFAIAVTALGLAVRFLAISLRPKESVSAAPGDRSKMGGTSPLHAAALSLAQAQLGGAVQLMPDEIAARSAAVRMRSTSAWAPLPPAGWPSFSGPLPALGAAPAYAESSSGAYASAQAGPSGSGYQDLGFTPLGAPPYGDDVPAGFRGRPYAAADAPTLAAPASLPGPAPRQPLYEPGYDGPPRFAGAPRGHLPQDELASYP
jgi:DMSO/TMAO reductase YedYZ heme-binding membrane subunit